MTVGNHRAPRASRPRWHLPDIRHLIVGGVLGGILALILHPAFPASGPQAAVPSEPATPLAAQPVAAGSTTTGPLSPAEFAPGACVALPPTRGDRHRTVFLDAGHGGADPGASGTTDSGDPVDEKTVTLPVAVDAAAQLRADGYRVVLSRTTDTAIARLADSDVSNGVLTTHGEHATLVARVHCADLSDAAALVSIHFDAYDDGDVRGATTLYDPDRPFADDNQKLANLLQQNVCTALAGIGWAVTDRGIATDTTAGGGEITPEGTAYGHLDLLGPANPGYLDAPTPMPGALVEPLFLTNPTEAGIATDPAGQHAIATGITHAIDQFLTKH